VRRELIFNSRIAKSNDQLHAGLIRRTSHVVGRSQNPTLVPKDPGARRTTHDGRRFLTSFLSSRTFPASQAPQRLLLSPAYPSL
jgi:hypothetical protein